MNNSLNLDIKNIQIIVHKSEDAKFRFYTPKRSYDGMILITHGNGFVTEKNGVKHAISEGDVVLVNENDEYSIEFPEPSSYITTGLDLETDKTLLPLIHKCTKEQLKKIVEICKIWQSRSWDSYTMCRIGLMQFYYDIIKHTSKTDKSDDFVTKAISYIHKNFKNNFSGKEIADYCSVSLSYLRSIFLKQTGKTIVEYRDFLRIAAAKEMLESKYFTVTEIASELGYCDVYHFSKIFKHYVGISPSQWNANPNIQKIVAPHS